MEHVNTIQGVLSKTRKLQEGMIRIFRGALSATQEELGIVCLSVAKGLTSSEFGFIGEALPDGSVHDVAISGPGWELCLMHDQTGHHPTPGDFSRYGLYGWVLNNGKSIISNDPSKHPTSVGIPEGHPPLHSFLGVPLLDGNRIVGIIALANREGGYRDEDRELIENISPAIVEAFSRKRSEDKLLQSERNYRELVENVNSIVVRWKKDGTLVFMNTYGLQFFGYTENELIGKNIRILVPERDPQGVDLTGLIQDIASFPEKYVSNVNQAIRHDGTHVWMSWTNRATYDEHGSLSEILAIGSDITDQKRMEDEIRQSRNELERRVQERTSELEHERQLLKTIFDNIPVMLVLYTKGHQIPVINRETERLTGWSQNDQNTVDIIAELYPDPKYREEVLDHILNPRHQWKDFKTRTRDGRVLETRWMTVCLDEDSKIGIGLDMTEINQLHETIRQSHKMEAIGTLAGGIAHDFNNILAAIIGFTELSVEDVSDRPITENNLKNVLKSAIRAKDLVTKILTFSRKSTYSRDYLSVTHVVRDTITMLRASIPANIDLELSITSEQDGVFAASIEIQQIIMNLITNAYLAVPDHGGNIRISISDVDFAFDYSSLDRVSGDFLQITVTDSGHGMTKDEIRRIFDPFYTTREPGIGTGLGLPVIYGIVKDLEGYISVESEVGSGTTFRVFLPKATTNELVSTTAEVAPEEGSERILFVDDEILLVDLAKAALGKLGYDFTGTTDANEAIRLFSEDPTRFDLIITDQAMPFLTGKELARKALKIRPDVPIILCTGHSATFSPDDARHLGIKAYLTKPIDKNEMGKVVRSVLDKKIETSDYQI